ncbi:MAG TPA: ABC transporter ATP-binding protein [Thermoplasmata archaeon]|nr:ABC transporter ATP-binding protein [Thermoplasmata archaeon]
MPAAIEPALRLSGVSVTYGSRRALQDVDLDVASGEFLALTGPNGSGKSTLLRAALGLVDVSGGVVELFGTPVGRLSIRDRAHRVAWVPQEEGLREDVPLFRYVLYGRYASHGTFGRETEADRGLVRTALAEVGLADRAADGLLSLSGGERQRAVLARALSQGAPLVLLDEPTSHLDVGHQLDLLSRVRRLVRERQLTAVAALHDLNLAARFADRIVVLARGRCVADGPPGEILSSELLGRVWGVDAELRRDPASGLPYLISRRLVADRPVRPSAALRGPVHVVGGGGSASGLLRTLTDAGFELSVGALHLLDTDAETAEALAIPAAIEAPFAPLGATVRARHAELLSRAAAIVVAPFAVGPSNVANLEDLRPFVGRVPVLLLDRPPISARDFCGGRAVSAYRELLAGGATEVAGEETLVATLRRASPGAPVAAPPAAARRPSESAEG